MMRICVFLIFVLSFVSSFGSTLDEAKKVYLTGNYEEALPLLEEQYKKNKRNASVNQWIGVCLFNLGRYDDARDYFEYAKSRKVVGAYKYLALLDFYSYKFDVVTDEDVAVPSFDGYTFNEVEYFDDSL